MRSIYTDLAREAVELDQRLEGVTEEEEKDGEIGISRIRVSTEQAAQRLKKREGNYITLEAPSLVMRPLELFERLSNRIAEELTRLLPNLAENATVLIAGLGNRGITSDSLGPRVVEQLFVTRHITQLMPEAFDHPLRSVCAIAPGVLGVTGVETVEIIKGIKEHVKPDIIIAIDSLAARRSVRIGTTVQIADTGISPGSGVGNMRAGIDSETLGVKVVAIGIPLVVYAATVAQDTIELIADETGLHNDEEKLKELAEKVISEHMGPMIMTPKDIDCMVNDMSRIIADGINMAIHTKDYDDIRALVT